MSGSGLESQSVPGDVRSRESIFLSAAGPFIICFTFMFVPYLLFNPSRFFPIELFVSKTTHVLLCTMLISFLGFAAWIGNKVGKNYLRESVTLRFSPIYITILWGLLLIAVAAHLVLVATSGWAYVRGGGFVGAREAMLFQGLGVLIRLYMPVLPLLALGTKRPAVFYRWVTVIGILVLLRAFIMSERLAIIEYVSVLWITARALKLDVTLRHVIIATGVVAVLFSAVLAVRLVQQNDIRIRGSGMNAMTTTVAYYADTQNKLYFFGGTGRKLPYSGYGQPIDALSRDKAGYYSQFEVYLKRMSYATRVILPMLTNPGGMTLMVSDFGVLLGCFAAALGFAVAGFVFAQTRGLGFSLLVGPLMAVQVADFPRENYMELPFCAYIAFVALGLWLLQPAFASKVFLPAETALLPRLGSRGKRRLA